MKKDFSSFLAMLKASLDLSGRMQTPTLLTPVLLCAPASFLFPLLLFRMCFSLSFLPPIPGSCLRGPFSFFGGPWAPE